MSYKIFLRAVDELWKLIDFSECFSSFEMETYSRVVWATNNLLICMIDYISEERKQDKLNTL